MGAYATITIPVDVSARGAAAVAQRVVEDFPGTRNVSLDAANGKIAFELQFPGNLSALAGRLRGALIQIGDHVDVSFPFRVCTPEALDPSLVVQRLTEGPEVWDVQFPRGRYVLDARVNGGRVEASVVPSTSSMHELYDALLSVGALVDEESPSV
jgi:hypothetical protein